MYNRCVTMNGNFLFDHVAIDYSQLYRPAPWRNQQRLKSENFILDWSIGDMVNRVPPTMNTCSATIAFILTHIESRVCMRPLE